MSNATATFLDPSKHSSLPLRDRIRPYPGTEAHIVEDARSKGFRTPVEWRGELLEAVKIVTPPVCFTILARHGGCNDSASAKPCECALLIEELADLAAAHESFTRPDPAIAADGDSIETLRYIRDLREEDLDLVHRMVECSDELTRSRITAGIFLNDRAEGREPRCQDYRPGWLLDCTALEIVAAARLQLVNLEKSQGGRPKKPRRAEGVRDLAPQARRLLQTYDNDLRQRFRDEPTVLVGILDVIFSARAGGAEAELHGLYREIFPDLFRPPAALLP